MDCRIVETRSSTLAKVMAAGLPEHLAQIINQVTMACYPYNKNFKKQNVIGTFTSAEMINRLFK